MVFTVNSLPLQYILLNYKEYAVDGVLLYSSFLSKTYDVLSIAVSGEDKNSIGGLFSDNKINIIRSYKTETGLKAKDLDWNNEIYIKRV